MRLFPDFVLLLFLLHTPTIKARFTRLVNVGFIRFVFPILNFDLIEKGSILGPEHNKEYNKDSENSRKL